MWRSSTLITPHELAARLDDPQLVVVDCRFSLADSEQGQRDYHVGHLPGARYAHLDRDLAGPITEDSGRHPLPAHAAFVATLRGWGVSNDSQVVVYDDGGGAIAARLWWMLRRWLDHQAVAVLNGGFAAWTAAGLEVTSDIPTPGAGSFARAAVDHSTIAVGELQAALADTSGFVLVDARDAARFRGEVEPIDPVAGHVPGARNLPFTDLLHSDGRWREQGELRERWRGVLPKSSSGDWAVMCGSGVTASHLALAADIAGLPAPRLYVGSWSEWLRDRSRPVGTGG